MNPCVRWIPLALLLSAPAGLAQQTNSGLLRVTLVTAQRELDVFLLERKGDILFYRPPNVPVGVMAQVRLSEVQDS